MTTVDLKALQGRMALTLKEFAQDPTYDSDASRAVTFRPAAEDVPVPELVLIALRDVMGFRTEIRLEKVRWSVSCAFRGRSVAFELRKSGFTVVHQGDADSAAVMMGLLQKAVRLVEHHLQAFAADQSSSGNVTLANNLSQFDRRYWFFREKANEAYTRTDDGSKPTKWDGDGLATAWAAVFKKGGLEGSHYTAAMLDAYFSRLEHLLVLLLPFVGFVPAGGALLRFIGGGWDAKYKGVLDIAADDEAKRLYDRLWVAKERFRNPLAHGGFEKGWASMHFHMPKVGPLPAIMTGFRDSLQFGFLPVDHDDHRELCELFDDLDAHIAKGPTKIGFMYVHTGLDVAFDSTSLAKYKRACGSAQEMNAFIDACTMVTEMHVNMDY